MQEEIPGFSVLIHPSLTHPLMIAGVPRTLAIINCTVLAAIVLGLQSFYIIPISLLVHVVSVFLAKKDPDFLAVLMRHLKQKRYYSV